LADIVAPEIRSRMMQAIRSKDTKPELAIRSGLHALGYRFRLHRRSLPGTPDLVFPSRRAVVFVHGCFWHRHQCHLFKWPKARQGFWRKKIMTNARNDARHLEALREDGWRILVIWECALKGKTRLPDGAPVLRAARWLEGKRAFQEILGTARPVKFRE
jgi:DNA mismatch endonuclease, patch repair protein